MAGRSYTAGKFAMQLDGSDVGFVVAVEGGEAFANVVDEKPVGARVGKHLAGIGHAPIVVEVGVSMAPTFYNWVAAMLDGTQTAKNGAILMLDYDMKERLRLEWQSALITEVGFPAADASNKESARMRVKIQPELTQSVAGSGARYAQVPAKSQKAFLGSNFRFTVSGLEAACTKVTKVAPLVVRLDAGASLGPHHEPEKGTALDVSDLAFWLRESDVAPFAAWFDEFAIKGNNDAKHERTATLAFLDPGLKEELMRLELEGVGIFRVSHERQEEGSSAQAQVKVEMYCEAIRLAGAKAAPEAAPKTADPVSAAVESLASALVVALQGGSIRSVMTPDAIADRLLTSVGSVTTADERDRGRAAGRAWASQNARLDELEEMARLAEHDDWTAIALAEGHSLIGFLAAAGDLPVDEIGPIDLRRDKFTSGLASGAAEVYLEVGQHLGERRPPRA